MSKSQNCENFCPHKFVTLYSTYRQKWPIFIVMPSQVLVRSSARSQRVVLMRARKSWRLNQSSVSALIFLHPYTLSAVKENCYLSSDIGWVSGEESYMIRNGVSRAWIYLYIYKCLGWFQRVIILFSQFHFLSCHGTFLCLCTVGSTNWERCTHW